MENFTVKKLQKKFSVEMNVPGSKSLTLRDLSLAALVADTSIIRYPADCNDTDVMVSALQKFGAQIKNIDNYFEITGIAEFTDEEIEVDLGGSGISARFLLAMSLLRKGKTKFIGNQSLSARPQGYLLDCLKALGAKVEDNEGRLPVTVTPPTDLSSLSLTMKGDVSSQYFSALFQIAPLFPNGLRISVEGELVSKPYIDLTISEMKKFGVTVVNNNYQSFEIANQKYTKTDLTVEGDASGASYFIALAVLHNSEVKINNLSNKSLQGDLKFISVMERLGAKIELTDSYLKVVGPEKMNSLGECDFEPMPDVAPTLMVLSPFIPGGVRITGLGTLRLKECDRIGVPVTEFAKLKIQCAEGTDWIYVPELLNDPDTTNVSIDTYDDHRIAMSFAVLGSKLGELKINDPRCVNKTYPKFWEDLNSLYE